MQQTALVPYAHLPQAHHDRHVLTSTVDICGAAHWLLAERAPQPGGDVLPFDALVVSVDLGGNVELTELSAVRAGWPHLDRRMRPCRVFRRQIGTNCRCRARASARSAPSAVAGSCRCDSRGSRQVPIRAVEMASFHRELHGSTSSRAASRVSEPAVGRMMLLRQIVAGRRLCHPLVGAADGSAGSRVADVADERDAAGREGDEYEGTARVAGSVGRAVSDGLPLGSRAVGSGRGVVVGDADRSGTGMVAEGGAMGIVGERWVPEADGRRGRTTSAATPTVRAAPAAARSTLRRAAPRRIAS